MEDQQTQQIEPINQVQPPQSPFRHWLPTIVGVTVVVLAVGGFSAWQFFQTPEDGGITVPQTTDETASWETYRNEEFGFEVKYPDNWALEIVDSIKNALFINIKSPSDNLLTICPTSGGCLDHGLEAYYERTRETVLVGGRTNDKNCLVFRTRQHTFCNVSTPSKYMAIL